MPATVHLDSVDHLAQRERLLLEAAAQQDLATVQQQLDAGAHVSAADVLGLTALHVAAATGQRDMVAALLAAGAAVTAKTRRGFTPLVYLTADVECRGLYAQVVQHSSGGLVIEAHHCDDMCHNAAQVVQQLVEAGARVQQYRRGEKPPLLHTAAASGCQAWVAALLQAGASVSNTTPLGYTVLHAAASSGSHQVVQQVLGALGPTRAAKMVVELGKERSYGDASTPLHLAAERGYPEVVEALVAAGADREQQDACKRTAVQVALSHDNSHLVPLLLTPGTVNGSMERASPLHLAAVLPPRRPPYNEPCWCQKQATQAVEAVAALLAAGADARAKDRTGCTPLDTAAKRGHPAVLRVLLEHELVLQQQQQAQAAQTGRAQLLPPLLRQLGARIFGWPNGPTWGLLLTLAADTLSKEGMHNLWGDLKQQQLGMEGSDNAAKTAEHRTRHVLKTWADCWAAACSDLATQRASITERLQQLVPRPQQQEDHHHHQQQDQQTEAGPATKRARQTSRLQHDQQQQLPPWEAAAACPMPGASSGSSSRSSSSRSTSSSSISSTAARPDPRVPTAAGPFRELTAIAAFGDEQGVLAALAPLPDRAAGLSAAAAAAGGAGHWRLCVALYRELLMLDKTKGGDVWWQVQEAVSTAVKEDRWPTEKTTEEAAAAAGQQEPQKMLQAAMEVCDAFLADWLAMQEQQLRELREAVVAAVAAARTWSGTAAG